DVAARHHLSPAHVLRFDANLPPFAARLAVSPRHALAARGEYPEGSYRELREAAAAYAGCAPDELAVDAGADGLIGLVARTFLGPGSRAVTEHRTYPLYAIASRPEGAEVDAAPRQLAALAAARPRRPRRARPRSPRRRSSGRRSSRSSARRRRGGSASAPLSSRPDSTRRRRTRTSWSFGRRRPGRLQGSSSAAASSSAPITTSFASRCARRPTTTSFWRRSASMLPPPQHARRRCSVPG